MTDEDNYASDANPNETVDCWGCSLDVKDKTFLANLRDLAGRDQSPEPKEEPEPAEETEPAVNGGFADLGKKDARSYPQKLRYELIPPEAEKGFAAALTYGAIHYSARNWEKGLLWSDIVGAIRRHLAAILEGELIDKKSGLPHSWLLHCETGFLLTMMERRPDLDNITPDGRSK